jgi:hypothetical protein
MGLRKEGVMPKEVIYGESLHLEGTPDGEWEHPIAELRWSRDTGDVQLTTRSHGAEVPSLEEYETGVPVQYGYSVSLNRRAINDLIRQLRRARDQACGRDE